jgi:hypothetical protein
MAEKPSIDETRQEGVPVIKVTCAACRLVIFVEASDPKGTRNRCGTDIDVNLLRKATR